MKSFAKYLAVCVLLLLVVFVSLFTFIDNTPYHETEAYKTTFQRIEYLQPSVVDTVNDFKAGWSKVNLLPSFSTPIAIDAARKGKHFESVRDSVFVKTFVFHLGNVKIAYVCADLLIIPPLVVDLVDSLLQNEGYSRQNIFYTATHTHSSIGAWHNSVVGEIFAGIFDERIPLHIAQIIKKSVIEAENNLSNAKAGSILIPSKDLVVNRLVGSEGLVDTTFRMLKIQKETGEEALIFSFTAHATIFHETVMHISGDWPSAAIEKINQQRPDVFAAFSAGAVGSHGPFEHSDNQENQLEYISSVASEIVLNFLDSIMPVEVNNLNMQYLPVTTRPPHFRVAENWALRPIWFIKLFGKASLHINFLELGNTFFAGMPCDFSGELTYNVEPTLSILDKHLFVTSFNGAYAGYITRDKWYKLDAYETRTMAWLGRGNGDYFSEILNSSISKIFHNLP